MQLIAIANLIEGKQPIGFKILDADIGHVKDLSLDQIRNILADGKTDIDNLILDGFEIKGYNGSIDRLPKIINGKLSTQSPLIIINQVGIAEYTVSDYRGTMLKWSESDVIKYAKQYGIANGKIVKKDGKEFISAIEGSYKQLEANYKQSNLPYIKQFKREECDSYTKVKGKLKKSSSMGSMEIKLHIDKNHAALNREEYNIRSLVRATPIAANTKYDGLKKWYLHSIIYDVQIIDWGNDKSELIDVSPKSEVYNWQEKNIQDRKAGITAGVESAPDKTVPKASATLEVRNSQEIAKTIKSIYIDNTVFESKRATWKLKTNTKTTMESTGTIETSMTMLTNKQKHIKNIVIIEIEMQATFVDNEKFKDNHDTNLGEHLQRSAMHVTLTIYDGNVTKAEINRNVDIEKLDLQQIMKNNTLLNSLKNKIIK